MAIRRINSLLITLHHIATVDETAKILSGEMNSRG